MLKQVQENQHIFAFKTTECFGTFSIRNCNLTQSSLQNAFAGIFQTPLILKLHLPHLENHFHTKTLIII